MLILRIVCAPPVSPVPPVPFFYGLRTICYTSVYGAWPVVQGPLLALGPPWALPKST